MMNAAPRNRAVIGFRESNLPAAGQRSWTATIPTGLGRLVGILYNPQLDSTVNLSSQKTGLALVSDFCTLVGQIGYLQVDYNNAIDDRLTVTLRNNETVAKNVHISMIFEE